jgi:1-acyl-sn-glycerol-3-phosphate acyltransferase
MAGRPFLRPLLVWMIAAPYLALAVSAGFLLAPVLGRRRAFWLLAPAYIRHMAAAFGLHRHLEGWEALPDALRTARQPALFVANHASFFDPPLLISTLPSRPVFIVKQELAWVPFLGWVIWLAGFIFVDRGRKRQAVQSVKSAADQIRAGQSVAAFPEGTRTRTGAPLPFKKGVFALAKDAGVPVVPLGILGGFRILPPDDWRVAPAHYTIRVGQPLLPQDFATAQALMETAEQAVLRLLERESENRIEPLHSAIQSGDLRDTRPTISVG